VNVRLLAQQFYSRGQFSGNSITSLDVTGEHKFQSIMTGRTLVYEEVKQVAKERSGQNKVLLWRKCGLKLDLAYEHRFW